MEEDEGAPKGSPMVAPYLDDFLWKALQEYEERAGINVSEESLMGTIITVQSRTCTVVIAGKPVVCQFASRPGSSPDLAVGDEAEVERRGDVYMVLGVKRRRTKLSRPDPDKSRQEMVIVANIDWVVVVVSVKSPPLHPRLIDRYLMAVQRGGAKMAIAVNKLDLLETPEERAEELSKLAPYRSIGVPVVLCSAALGEGRAELLDLLRGSLSAFVGHSGVGKSSLLNALKPDLGLQVGAVSEGYGRGTHTTTASTLWELDDDTRVIDTPGIRSFGLWDISEEEVPWYFPEFAQAGRCKFRDCTHTHEPQCAVKEAVESGAISEERYDTYLRIRESL